MEGGEFLARLKERGRGEGREEGLYFPFRLLIKSVEWRSGYAEEEEERGEREPLGGLGGDVILELTF